MWLVNVTVVDPVTGQTKTGCSVEVERTGVVIEGWPPNVPAHEVVDASGSCVVANRCGIREIADALQAAIIAGDVDAAARLYADDIVIWHNYDGIDRDKTEALATIAAIHEEFSGFDAANVRRDYLSDGYVQRTVFHGVTADAQPFRSDAMMRVWTNGTRITRIEEYSTPEDIAR